MVIDDKNKMKKYENLMKMGINKLIEN